MTKDRPESARYGEGDVLPFTVRQHMLLLVYPPFGGFDATTATSTRLTAIWCRYSRSSCIYRAMIPESQAIIRVRLSTTTSLISEMCLLRQMAQVPFREKNCLSDRECMTSRVMQNC